MNEKAILHCLTGIPFFTDFSAEELKNLVSEKKYFLNFSSGEAIVEEGTIDKTLYILLKGKARVTKKSGRNDIAIFHINEGAVYGMMHLISKRERTYKCSIVSEEETMVAALTPDYFKSLDSMLQIKIKEQLLEIMFTRIEHLIGKHTDLMREMLF